MAYVVQRADGRYEIRESTATPAGPRSRTLATFRALSDADLDRAQERARGRFDREAVEMQARRRGAPRAASRASRLARELLGELRRGREPGPALARLLRADLAGLADGGQSLPDSIPPMLEWVGVSPERRGAALRDLLRLASRVPRRSRRPTALAFPKIRSTAA